MSHKNVFKNSHSIFLYYSVITISIFSFIAYLIFSFNFDVNKDHTILINILSWLGILIAVYVLITWYKLTGKLFSLYTIFIMFFFLFNFGQPLMWALGIHQENEIGKVAYYTLNKPTSGSIVYTQIITLISIIMFHFGAFFCYKPKKTFEKNITKDSQRQNEQTTLKAILYTCLILSLFVIPITFYNSIYNLIYSQTYGYGALYYDESKMNIVVFNLLQRMFFPCLVGLLVGSNYNKKIRYFVYIVFLFYMIVNLLSGDRGSWIYYLILLIFMSHNYYKKMRWKQLLSIAGIGLIFLHIVNVIVELRRTIGINVENIISTFSLNNSPIVEFVFEMGGSMKPSLVLVQSGWDIWPYTNTYLLAFIGLLPNMILSLFDIHYTSLGSWFSQDYLGISYGAGFSIVAEPLLNFGPIFGPLFMVLIGYVISSLTFLDKNSNLRENSLKIFFAVSTMSVFINITRGHFQHNLNQWVYSVVIMLVIILLMKSYLRSKSFKNKRSVNYY